MSFNIFKCFTQENILLLLPAEKVFQVSNASNFQALKTLVFQLKGLKCFHKRKN